MQPYQHAQLHTHASSTLRNPMTTVTHSATQKSFDYRSR